MKKTDDLHGLHNVQTKLNDHEYYKFRDYANNLNVSQVRALRGIIVQAIDNDPNPVRDIVLTIEEKNFVRRVIDIYRSGDKMAMDGLISIVKLCERAIIAAGRHRSHRS